MRQSTAHKPTLNLPDKSLIWSVVHSKSSEVGFYQTKTVSASKSLRNVYILVWRCIWMNKRQTFYTRLLCWLMNIAWPISLLRRVYIDKAVSHEENRNPERLFPPTRSKSGRHSRGEGSHDQRSRVPGGPSCFYCKQSGHVMSECGNLEQKEKNKPKADLIVHKAESIPTVAQCNMSEYKPFIS